MAKLSVRTWIVFTTLVMGMAFTSILTDWLLLFAIIKNVTLGFKTQYDARQASGVIPWYAGNYNIIYASLFDIGWMLAFMAVGI